MTLRRLSPVLAAACLISSAACAAPAAPPADWPAWRGPLHTGVSPDGKPPTVWSADRNVAWKTPIPGLGHSSPVVTGGRVLLTSAVKTDLPNDTNAVEAAQAALETWQRPQFKLPTHGLRFSVHCVDFDSGRILWEKALRECIPYAGTHAGASWASPSCVTDGAHVYAFFGSYGLYALTVDGEPVWRKDLGVFRMRNNFGEGTSPALSGDRLVVVCDHEGDSFIVALDKLTGNEIWRNKREEVSSWATPLILDGRGAAQVIASATGRVRGYALDSGNLLWECAGMTLNVIPCPVEAAGILYAMSGFRGSALLAIRLANASGDITSTPPALPWRLNRNTPYVPSPVLHDGSIYFLSHNRNQISCLDAATGRPHYELRELPGLKTIYSSPVLAGGNLYVSDTAGTTCVVAAGPEFRVVATNRLNDAFTASAAVCGDALLLRGHRSLYCLRAPAEPR